MKVLGVRCSNNDYAYCILSGTREAPVIEKVKKVDFPSGYTEPESLRWFYQEMRAVFNNQGIGAVGIKRAETSVLRSNTLELRIQNEAIVSLAAIEAGCSSIERKVKSTVAKDLGLKGKAKYLDMKLDTSPIHEFGKFSSKQQEAILVAWSCMD